MRETLAEAVARLLVASSVRRLRAVPDHPDLTTPDSRRSPLRTACAASVEEEL